MTRLPFGPEWPTDRADAAALDDGPTLADRYDTDTTTPRRSGPIPAPCPVCLKHVGHYPERHPDTQKAAA